MIKGMTLAKGGNKLPLVLGLILGLIAAVLVVVVLTGSKESTTTVKTTSGSGPLVVVAARDVPAGTRLTAADLKTVPFPEGAVPVGSFGTIDEAVTGKVARVAIVTNDPVLAGKITGSGDFVAGENPPIAFVVEPGMRGVSVGVSPLIGAGGNIRPGDFIDVVLIVGVKAQGSTQDTQGTSDQLAATILQNVKVLAVDQSVTNPNSDTTSDPSEAKSANEAATTLTLQVTPGQGEVLAMAEVCSASHGGRLSVSLRSAGDTARLPNRPEFADGGPPPTCSAILGISSLGE